MFSWSVTRSSVFFWWVSSQRIKQPLWLWPRTPLFKGTCSPKEFHPNRETVNLWLWPSQSSKLSPRPCFFFIMHFIPVSVSDYDQLCLQQGLDPRQNILWQSLYHSIFLCRISSYPWHQRGGQSEPLPGLHCTWRPWRCSAGTSHPSKSGSVVRRGKDSGNKLF